VWRDQGAQMDAELENLLAVNEMSQDTIKALDDALDRKDLVIEDQAKMIAKATEGSAQELRDLELRFFTN